MAVSRRSARKSEADINDGSPSSIYRLPIHSSSAREHSLTRIVEKRRPRLSWFFSPRPRSRPPSPREPSTPSSPSSGCRLSHPSARLSVQNVISFIKIKYRNHPIHVTVVGFIVLVALRWLLILLTTLLVGPRGSIKGGMFGWHIDQYSRDRTRYQTISKWREEVRSLGLSPGQLNEPWFLPWDQVMHSRPNYATVDMLLREKRRVEKLNSLIQSIKQNSDNCSRDGQRPIDVPRTILQLLPHQEQPPLPPHWLARGSIEIDSLAIRSSDIDIHQLSETIKRCLALSENNLEVFADADLQCVAHLLGGMQLSKSFTQQQHARPHVDSIFSLISSSTKDPSYSILGGGTCHSKVGYAVLSNVPTPEDELRKTSAISSRVSTIFAGFPPNHPASVCIPPMGHTIGISPYNEANIELSFHSIFANKLLTELERKNFNTSSPAWGLATLSCDLEHDEGKNMVPFCCNQVSVDILDSIGAKDIATRLKKDQNDQQNKHHLIFTSSKMTGHEKEKSRNQSNTVSVTISEDTDSQAPPPRRKESMQMELRNKWRCEPSWFCQRCLQSSIQGTFSKCRSTCGDCTINAICNEGEDASTIKQIRVDALVTGHHHLPTATALSFDDSIQSRIPRIIHQTYYEEITIDKYPHLYRLQNTWRASGWEYRFYTDDAAREYIKSNYPLRFVSAFDSILPGAYKADFFRYLVLYKEGGVYVDVDVMLNTNLDSFLVPDLAFFAPLDAVGNFADEQFCVWNGLLGSAPAHPALKNVIEWMVNLVSTRADIYDMERAVCQFSGIDKVENWKVRAEPGLMLSGPCALGLAVNRALGNEPLSKFRTGLLGREGFNEKKEDVDLDKIGNVMFLVADKDDLGEMRFSDPERNIMIASTEMVGLIKSPIMYETHDAKRKKGLKQKPHYSISTKGEQLWGTHDVYKDDLVEDEQVSLGVSYVNK